MIQFLNNHQNIVTASIFKTQMFWAMEIGTLTTSLHAMCSVTFVSVMSPKSTGHCLSYHLSIQYVAAKGHFKSISELEKFSSSFSVMAKLANEYSTFKYVHIQPDHYRNC